MDKIKRISRLFRILFQILFYLQPIFTAIYWALVMRPGSPLNAFGVDLPIHPAHFTLNTTSRLLGFIVSLCLPTALWMCGLYCLIKLFRYYEAGKVFAVDNVRQYRNFGYILFAWFFANFIYQALISLVLTFQNVGYKKVIMVGIGTNDMGLLVISGIIILISWIMKEGVKLSQEQSLTI